MKHARNRTFIAGCIAALALPLAPMSAPAQGSPGVSMMLNTKHDLSVSGTGQIRASTEGSLCVFCHTPHVPSGYQADQLWNHELTTANYELYSSDYLTSLNYAGPDQPNERSKLCLSCHDGTVAIGAVYNNGGGPMTIEMQNDVVTMPPGNPGYIGTSLLNDHPVGYVYDNSRDPELVGRGWPWSTPVHLDPDAPDGTVECQTCHDPHSNKNGYFLRVANTGAALCTFCHSKTGWTESAHSTSPQPLATSDTSGTTVGEWACRSCHKSHNGEGVPYLLTRQEENTCFTAGCHGSTDTGPATVNIQSELGKLYAHPTLTVSGSHRDPDTQSSLNVPNRHAECQDCHNPHQSKAGLHSAGSNLLSGTLAGVEGVAPGTSNNWTQTTTYTELKPALRESQLCFKCHSSYAFGLAPGGVTTIAGPSGTNITDQAMEFNPANRSAHPVQVGSLGQSGSTAPQALQPGALTSEWGSPGTQTMYCSDCHGSDQPASPTVPQGPHGSDYRFMLTGPAKYWPENANGEPWSLNDIQTDINNWQNDLFCVNCHPMKVNGLYLNNVHEAGQHQGGTVKCITCHVTVPHGSKRSRLIGYASDPAPYNYQGAGPNSRLVIEGFRKAPGPFNYEKQNCTMTGICHGTQAGAFED
jgi:predicted CXXCH cytochrome family protein